MTASSEPERRWLRATWSPEPGTRPRQQLPLLGLPLDPVWPPRASPGSALHIALTLPGPRPPPSAPSPQPLSGPRPPAFPSFVHSGHQEGWAPSCFCHTQRRPSHFTFLTFRSQIGSQRSCNSSQALVPTRFLPPNPVIGSKSLSSPGETQVGCGPGERCQQCSSQTFPRGVGDKSSHAAQPLVICNEPRKELLTLSDEAPNALRHPGSGLHGFHQARREECACL